LTQHRLSPKRENISTALRYVLIVDKCLPCIAYLVYGFGFLDPRFQDSAMYALGCSRNLFVLDIQSHLYLRNTDHSFGRMRCLRARTIVSGQYTVWRTRAGWKGTKSPFTMPLTGSRHGRRTQALRKHKVCGFCS
jgi:hypothetical protein